MPSQRTRLALLNENYRTSGGTVGALLTESEASTTYQPVDATLTAFAAVSTVGLLAMTSTSDAFSGRTITAGSTRLSVTAGNGSTGNPTLDVAAFPSTYLSDTANLARTTTSNTFAGAVSVPDATYGSSWNASAEVPTKNAVYDKVETLAASTAGSFSGVLQTEGFAANLRSVSAHTTAVSSDFTILVDASGAAVTVELPAVSTVRRIFAIKKIDSSTNAVVIDGNGAETIDGAATQSIVTQWSALTVHASTAAWFLI